MNKTKSAAGNPGQTGKKIDVSREAGKNGRFRPAIVDDVPSDGNSSRVNICSTDDK